MSEDERSDQAPQVAALEEADDFKPMVIGAALILVLSFIPYVRLACCLPYLLGALVAAYLFGRQAGVSLSYGRGIRLGIVTCLLGGFASWAVGMLIWLMTDEQPGLKEGQALGLWIAEKVGGEEAVKQAREQMAQQQAAGLTLGQVLIGVVGVGITAALSGLIGGSLGALVFRRGHKPTGV